ncbi:MAG: FimB/Mfa2 family fimbrial subunit [Phocaeicola sp.]
MKSKRVKIFLILPLIVGLLSGCIMDVFDDCLVESRISFTYFPKNALNDLFNEKVESINLFIYNSDGFLEHSQFFSKAEFDADQSITFLLAQGEYTVICWANATEKNTLFKGLSRNEKLNQIMVTHPYFETHRAFPTLDSLLFVAAPLSITEFENKNITLNFSPATIRINLKLIGISHSPLIRFSHLPASLNYESTNWVLQSMDFTTIVYEPSVNYDITQQEAIASVNVPRFRSTTPGYIELFDLLGSQIMTPISISELIAEYLIELDDNNEIVIPIEITFSDTNTKITITDWEETTIKPGGI